MRSAWLPAERAQALRRRVWTFRRLREIDHRRGESVQHTDRAWAKPDLGCVPGASPTNVVVADQRQVFDFMVGAAGIEPATPAV